MDNGIEIKEFNGEGYKGQIVYGAWRVALANYKPEWEYGRIDYIERHMQTDEVFVLLAGKVSLFIGEEMKEYVLEPGKLYNVKAGVFHQLCMDREGKVLIVENDNTTAENSEKVYLNNDEK